MVRPERRIRGRPHPGLAAMGNWTLAAGVGRAGQQSGQVSGGPDGGRNGKSGGCVRHEVARVVRWRAAPISSTPPLEGGTDRAEATVRWRRTGRLGVTDNGGRGWVSARAPAMAPVRPGATLGWLVGRRGWAHVKVQAAPDAKNSMRFKRFQGKRLSAARCTHHPGRRAAQQSSKTRASATLACWFIVRAPE
jgi:hypothetical protein